MTTNQTNDRGRSVIQYFTAENATGDFIGAKDRLLKRKHGHLTRLRKVFLKDDKVKEGLTLKPMLRIHAEDALRNNQQKLPVFCVLSSTDRETFYTVEEDLHYDTALEMSRCLTKEHAGKKVDGRPVEFYCEIMGGDGVANCPPRVEWRRYVIIKLNDKLKSTPFWMHESKQYGQPYGLEFRELRIGAKTFSYTEAAHQINALKQTLHIDAAAQRADRWEKDVLYRPQNINAPSMESTGAKPSPKDTPTDNRDDSPPLPGETEVIMDY